MMMKQINHSTHIRSTVVRVQGPFEELLPGNKIHDTNRFFNMHVLHNSQLLILSLIHL